MEAKPLTKSDYEAIAAFRYALRQFIRQREEAARKAGITPQHHQVLLAIKGFPGRDYANIGEIAERLQLKHHSAVSLISRLEANGLLERKHGKDRRIVYVSLTQKGETMLHRLTAPHREEILQIGEHIEELIMHLRGSPRSSVG